MSGSEKVDLRPDARAIAERLKPVTDKLEAFRRATVAKRKNALRIALGVLGCGWLAAFFVMSSEGEQAVIGLLIGGAGTVIAGLIHHFMAGGAKREYCGAFKAGVFAEAVQLAVPGMRYHPDSMVAESDFRQGDLFDSGIDRYNGEDCFRGRFSATDLIFSELHVERKETTRDSKGHVRTRWVTVFRGIYLVADFHKDFSCRVKIEPDFAEASFGWLGRKFQGLSGNLLRLENPRFEEAFKVTADDQVAARYLLTPDMQERFLALRGDWSNDLRAALTDSTLHLAIPLRENWFEPDINVPAGDAAVLHGFLNRLMMVLRITETLDLNTRIWTKT